MPLSIPWRITKSSYCLETIAAGVEYTEAALKDKITSLPGASDIPFNHFSGYLDISETKKLFYW